MRRLPALGTVVLFLGTLGLAVQASADPINIESGSYVASSSKPASLTFLGRGFSYSGRDRDFDAPELGAMGKGSYRLNHTFDDDFPLSRGSVNGISFNNLWLDGRFTVTSDSFTPSASGNSVPFQFTANMTGYAYSSEPGRDQQVFTQSLQGTGMAHVGYAQQSGGLLVPTSVAYNFGGASSVVTPEPASMLLLASGLGLVALRRRSRR